VSRRPRGLGVALVLWGLAVAGAAHADGGWVLWARSCNVKSQTCGGDWQRRETYEAERWCRAARATAVNKAFTPEASKAATARGTVDEYQCLPDTTAPPKGTK
jgi:hypothetical protein